MFFATASTLSRAVAALLSVRRDYGGREKLSARSVVLVWAVYLLHAAVVSWASLSGVWPLPIPPPAATALGLLTAAAGLALLSLAIWQFRSLQRMSGVETDDLITGRIYSWSRNPQNLGWGLALLGIAILGRSGLALPLVGAFALLVHGYIVRLKEPHLEDLHGEQYCVYLGQTGRYLTAPTSSSAGPSDTVPSSRSPGNLQACRPEP